MSEVGREIPATIPEEEATATTAANDDRAATMYQALLRVLHAK